MASLLRAAAGAFKGAASGLRDFATLRLSQEAEEAKFLRDQNMARFRAELAEETAIRAEKRAEERVLRARPTGFLRKEADVELTVGELEELQKRGRSISELRTKRGLLQEQQAEDFQIKIAQLGQLEAAKAEITDELLKDTIASGFPDLDKKAKKNVFTLLKRAETGADGKPMKISDKIALRKQAESTVQLQEIEPGSALYNREVNKEYRNLIQSLQPVSITSRAVSSAALRKGIIEPKPLPVEVENFIKSGDPIKRAEEEILNLQNISGLKGEDLQAAIAIVEATRDEALRRLEQQKIKPLRLGRGITETPIGPARGVSVLGLP